MFCTYSPKCPHLLHFYLIFHFVTLFEYFRRMAYSSFGVSFDSVVNSPTPPIAHSPTPSLSLSFVLVVVVVSLNVFDDMTSELRYVINTLRQGYVMNFHLLHYKIRLRYVRDTLRENYVRAREPRLLYM